MNLACFGLAGMWLGPRREALFVLQVKRASGLGPRHSHFGHLRLGMAFWLGAYWQLQLLRMSIILNIVFFSFFDGIVIPRGALLSNESGSL